MRFAYADPPYPGQAKRHYGPDAREVNHRLLVAHLETFDAWALSTSSTALQRVLAECPDDVRVAAWVKPFASFKPNVNPAYAWEPVIWKGGRRYDRTDATVRDWHSENITLQKGTHGAKPPGFWRWLFALVNLRPDDVFVDLFAGSGGGESAWQAWAAQTRMFA